jgi:hypothetical protein
MPPVEFEPTISAGERPQTYAIDRAGTRTCSEVGLRHINMKESSAGNIAQYGETPASNYGVPFYNSGPGSRLSFFVAFLRSVKKILEFS